MINTGSHPARVKWRLIKDDTTWKSYEEFRAWLDAQGYRLGQYQICRVSRDGPWGPNNTVLRKMSRVDLDHMGKDYRETFEFINRWNRTVNVLRAAVGWPLFEVKENGE